MTDFATLKKSSNTIDRLAKEIEKLNANQSAQQEEENNYFKLERDKAGNAFAVIRFLPAPAVDGDDSLPWVRFWDHGFKGPTGKWYIEKSLTTLNQKDPVSEYNSQQWNSTEDDNSPARKSARERKRRLHYVSNVLIVSYPKNPALEGQVKLFKYGKKIFNKIQDCFQPPFDPKGRTPEDPNYDPTNAFNPFDLWKGAHFHLRMRTVDGYPNYDASSWETPGPLFDDEKKMEKIWKSEFSLKEVIDPSNFKSYVDLKSKFEAVMGIASSEVFTQRSIAPDREVPRQTTLVEEIPSFDVDEVDDDLQQFRALAEG